MKTVAIFLMLLLSAQFCRALDITTRKGTTYTHCEITRVEKNGVTVEHRDGIAYIAFEDLPAPLQAKYHYDPVKVAADRQAAQQAAIKAAKENEERKAAAEQARREADRKIAEEKSAKEEARAKSDEKETTRLQSDKRKELLLGFFLAAFGICFYFLPTLIARMRGRENSLAIFALNLCLGWTLLGWVVALVWACTKVSRS